MFAAVIVAILLTMALALLRAALGPTVYDRILALNMMGTKTVLLIAVSGFLVLSPSNGDLLVIVAPACAVIALFTELLFLMPFVAVMFRTRSWLRGVLQPLTAEPMA